MNIKYNNRPRHSASRLLAALCAVLMMLTMLPLSVAAAAGDQYEGWLSQGGGELTYDETTHALRVNAMSAVQSLYLNGAGSDNEALFPSTAMTDFIIEFEMSVTNYPGKAAVDSGDAGAGGGAVSLAFLGKNSTRLDVSSITARIDYKNLGVMWRNYPDITKPSDYSYNYVNGTYKEWHWLFNYTNYKTVRVTKTGNTVTIAVDGTTTHTATLDANTGLPDSGYVGLLVEDADVTIRNLTVTDTISGLSETFFTQPHVHTWADATCTVPQTCACGETQGTALGHDYVEGTCSHCGAVEEAETGKIIKKYNATTATFVIYEQEDGSQKLVISGTGAIPVWSGMADYATTIKTLVIKDGLTAIAYGQFKGMTALESVTLPATLTAIDGEAFKECQNLKSINLEEGLTSIGYAAFLKSGLTQVTIPDSVTTMGKWVFANCKSLTTVTFGASKLAKKTLPARTFSGCTALKTVNFGSVLRIIDDYAFFQSGLEDLYLPANIKTVDNAAFYKAALKTVKIADGGATYLGWASFYGCPHLTDLYLGDSLTTISTWVFTACNSLKEVTVPNTVTNIGRRTFSWCQGLETVVLSSGMTEIKDELFYGSTKLSSVTIPNTVTAIGANSFYKCLSLTDITIPSAVTAIGNGAFLNCDSLSNVYINSSAIAAGLTNRSVYGGLIKNVKTIAIHPDVTTVPGFVTANYGAVGSLMVGGVTYVTYTDGVDGTVTVPSDLGEGTTYYVSSSTGNDANDGKTPETAFQTVDPINNMALLPGDNILLKRGDVFEGAHLEPRGSGEAADGKWITIDAYGDGPAPVFKNAFKTKAAISLSIQNTTQGYRIRNLEIDTYLTGITFHKYSMASAFDGLIIENVTIRNVVSSGDYGSSLVYPENLDAAYGLFLGFVRNATIRNVSVISSDIPLRMYGELTLIDNLYAYDNRVTGIMLYGAAYDSTYDEVMASAGGITVQNSRILYTGSSGLEVGTTGVMMQHTKNCTIKNTEVAYTTNGTGDNDGCALDWEELNIDCTIDGVYAHDNDGPFLLAMEHAETAGCSKGNKILNSISVNNGRRDHASGGSFMEHSYYKYSNQKITVENCLDVGRPGSLPYSYWETSGLTPAASLPSSRFVNNGFSSGAMKVYATFDGSDMSDFRVANGASISKSHLSMVAGGQLRTNYAGADYTLSTWLKGQADLVFMAGTTTGYIWRFEDGHIVAYKLVDGNYITLKTISVPGLDVDNWYRARVMVTGGTITTYVDDVQVDVLTDGSYSSGMAGINAVAATLVDEFQVYDFAGGSRTLQSPSLGGSPSGGKLTFTTASGESNEPINNWSYNGAVKSLVKCAHLSAKMVIGGKNAYISPNSMSARVGSSYKKVHINLQNATTNSTMYIDFTTDGGKTWHTKAFTVQAMSNDKVYPFKALWTEYTDYVVDMSDMAAWSGTINGLRVRTAASSGWISIKYVTITD